MATKLESIARRKALSLNQMGIGGFMIAADGRAAV